MAHKVTSSLYNKNKKILLSRLPKECPCPYCNAIMKKGEKNLPSSVTIDHIQPRSKGGQDTLDNLIAVCSNCNMKKASLEETNLFFLNEPRTLKKNEFSNLNEYVRFSNRYNILLSVRELLKKEALLEIVDLIQEQMKTTNHTRFYNRMLKKLREIFNKTTNFKKNLEKCLSWLGNLIGTERKHIKNYNEKIKHISFGTYSIISAQVKTQVVAQAA